MIISVNAQFSTVRGVIIDKQTQQTLVGATVKLQDSGSVEVAVTDINGEFILNNVPIGRRNFVINYTGYLPVYLQNVVVVKGKQTMLNVELQESVVDLGNVVVSATDKNGVTKNEMATVSVHSFSIEETERYAGSLGDPARMVANYAGVMSVNDQRNDIIIRGNSPLGLLWRLDGLDIPNPNHFGSMGTTGGPVSMLNNNVLSNSDFFTGAFPAEYGNALSGVFDLRMRSGNNKKYEFLLQSGFSGFEFGAEGPISRKNGSSFIINYRYSTLAVMDKLGFMGKGQIVPFYQDLNFKLNFPRGKFGKFSIFGLGGVNHISLLDSEADSAQYGYGGTDLTYANQMGTVGANYTYFLSNNTRINIKIAESYISQQTMLDSLYHNKILAPYRFYGSDGKTITSTFSSEIISRLNAKNLVKVGIILKRNKIYDLDSVYVYQLDDYFNQFDVDEVYLYGQLFSEYQHRFNNKATLNLGVFGHYLDFNKKYSFEPRLGFKWAFLPKHSLNLGLGMHSQTQLPLLYFVSKTDSLKTDEQPNKNLDYNKALHVVIGYDYKLMADMKFRVEVYYQYLYNIAISQRNEQYSVLNIGDDFYNSIYDDLENDGTGRNYGVELTVEKNISKGFYFLVNGSLFESKYTGADGIERNTKYNGNYIANALAGYELNLGDYSVLAFDVKTTYAGGKRYIPIDEEASELEATTVYKWDEAFENQYDAYFRLNLRITYKLNSKKHNSSQEWGVDLQNLTNHQNIYQQSWDVSSNSVKTYYQQGFMPMVTYRMLF